MIATLVTGSPILKNALSNPPLVRLRKSMRLLALCLCAALLPASSATWETLSSGDVDGAVIATPALAGSRICFRTEGTLYCFGVKS